MSSDKPSKPCYNCTKRRITCDLTPPGCKKCQKKGLECPGYGVRYRFTQGNIAPPSSLHKTEAPSVKRRRNDLKWIDMSHPKRRKTPKAGEPDSRTTSSQELRTAGSRTRESDEIPNFDLHSQKPRELVDSYNRPESLDETPSYPHETDVIDVEPTTRLNLSFFEAVPLTINLPPLLSHSDPKMRLLINHFNIFVSPVMLMYDDESNGYRHQILPLAHSDSVVGRAVCIVAAFHLSQRMPELRLPAESGRAAIVSKLSDMAHLGEYLSDSTWATIILLIVADLVMGHEHVITLYNMLTAFLGARGQSQLTSPLAEFLYYQSRLISFFTYPVLGESKAIVDFSEALCGPVSSVERYAPSSPLQHQLSSFLTYPTPLSQSLDARTQTYIEIMRHATETYLLRAQSATTPLDERQMQRTVDHMRELFQEVDSGAPGAHTLVWPAFVAAAEAQDVINRRFFSAVLQEIWETTGYVNVLRGLEALPMIWEQQGRRRWTVMLPDLKVVVM